MFADFQFFKHIFNDMLTVTSSLTTKGTNECSTLQEFSHEYSCSKLYSVISDTKIATKIALNLHSLQAKLKQISLVNNDWFYLLK